MGRLSSAVEIPEDRRHSHREYARRSPEYRPYGENHRRSRSLNRSRSASRNRSLSHSRSRSRSPVNNNYARYDNSHRRGGRDYSPDYSNYRRNPRSETLKSDRRFNNSGHDYRNNGRYAEFESDEELKGLPFEEYRRLKRQKLRKKLKNCIWNCTPSPPRFDNELEDQEPDETLENREDERVNGDFRDKEKDKESELKRNGNNLSSGSSESESESESDDMRSRRKRKSRKSSSRRRSRSGRRSRSVSESESESDESIDDSEDEDRKRRRKRRSRRKASRRSKSSTSSKKRSSNRKKSYSDETESIETESAGSDASQSSDDRVKLKKKRKQSKKSKKKESESESASGDEGSASEGEAKDKPKVDEAKNEEMDDELLVFKEMLEARKKLALVDELAVRPMPLPKAGGHISYGGALRPGEGDAIAQYVQQGKRIPRRGEVGLSAEKIQKFETLAYVMSGSRHQRMNVIHIRKENHVYSAEDKRALAMFNYEEKAKRQQKVMADLQRLVQHHIGQVTGPSHDPFPGKASEGAEG